MPLILSHPHSKTVTIRLENKNSKELCAIVLELDTPELLKRKTVKSLEKECCNIFFVNFLEPVIAVKLSGVGKWN